MFKTKKSFRFALGTALTAGALLLSSCASGGSPGSSPTEDAAASAAAAAQAQTAVSKFLAAGTQENTWQGPTTSPKPKAGLNVTIISQMNATGASRPAYAIENAAKSVGWNPTIVDNQGKPDVKLSAINAAVDQKADAIFLLYVDPTIVASGIKRAQEAGIPLITFGIVKDTPFAIPDVSADYPLQGKALAQYMVSKSNANLHLLLMEATDEYVVAHGQDVGVRDYFKDPTNCPGCTVQTKEYVLSNFLDPTSGPAAQAGSTLQADPTLNWVTCFDACLFQVISAVDRAGLADRVSASGFNCNPENLELIRKGHVQQACWADPFEWMGYAAVDNINRITNGEKPFNYTPAIPGALFDKSSLEVLPANKVSELIDKGWGGNFDFRSKFAELWGTK